MFERNNPPNKLIVRVVIGLAIFSYGIALLAEILFSNLIDRNPTLLIALNPSIKNLLLVQGDTYQIGSVSYYSTAFVRLLSSDPLYYLLGFWYGDKALEWIKLRSKSMKTLLEDNQTNIKHFAYVLVFISPVSYNCSLAAAVGMRFKSFLAVNVAGTVFTLYGLRWSGNRFSGPIGNVVDYIVQYRWHFLAVSVLAVAWNFRKDFGSDKSEVSALKNFSDK